MNLATGTTLDDEKVEEIKSMLALGVSKNQIASKLKLSWSTVDKYSKQDPDKLEDLREQKRSDFVVKLWNNIEDAVELGHSMIKEAKLGQRDIPLGQISTYVGTLYDKQALMTGGKTAEVGLSKLEDFFS
jgi:hypothetical protein